MSDQTTVVNATSANKKMTEKIFASRICTNKTFAYKSSANKTTTGRKTADKGFTLVEMVIVLSIFAILIGILIPSLNALIDYRATRAAKSIVSGFERMRTETESRLVAEMKLERKSDGYYISYCMYKGKQSGMVWSDETKIAPAKVKVEYKLDDYDTPNPVELEKGKSLIFTVDRNTGGFRPLQKQAVTTKDVNEMLGFDSDGGNTGSGNADGGNTGSGGKDLTYYDQDRYAYCYKIIVSGRVKKRTISLEQKTGKVTMTVS